jgi:hypothetical protein
MTNKWNKARLAYEFLRSRSEKLVTIDANRSGGGLD